jgi:SagB-type dehydrogenase family enzyme
MEEIDDNPVAFQDEDDQIFSISEIYHENSKMRDSDLALFRSIAMVNSSTEMRQVISRPFPRRRCQAAIRLPRDWPELDVPFHQALLGRRSSRDFSGESLSIAALARILFHADGVVSASEEPDGTVWHLRTAPSGGALFPIELHPLVFAVEGLQSGHYVYDPLQHCLNLVNPGDFRSGVADTTAMPATIAQAAVCIALTALPPRSRFKYGERSYRFILLEAGHIAQNILLSAAAAGLGAVAVAGFIDDGLHNLLLMDGCEEIVVYLVTVGAVGAEDPETRVR